jgi:hypothetical protein
MKLIDGVGALLGRKAAAFPNIEFEPSRPLAFMHIPKTSGCSLMAGLYEALHPTGRVGGFDLSMFGAFDAFDTVEPAMRRTVCGHALPIEDASDLICGHYAYSTIVRSRPNAQLMTALREPRSRLLSLWTFWRVQADDGLRPWGKWGDIVRLARRPLLEFLGCREAACQTDNVAVRMLLWPHPLVPAGDFIDGAFDRRLVGEATDRLRRFAFADVIENPEFETNLRNWLARPFAYARVNETRHVAPELRVPLRNELVPEALRLIEHRSRLDRLLWLALAGERIAAGGEETLSNDTFLGTVARHAALMAAA